MKISIDGLDFEGTVEEFEGLLELLDPDDGLEDGNQCDCWEPDCEFRGPTTTSDSFKQSATVTQTIRTFPGCVCTAIHTGPCPTPYVCVPSMWDADPCFHDFDLSSTMPHCKECGIVKPMYRFGEWSFSNLPTYEAVNNPANIVEKCAHSYVYDKDAENFSCLYCESVMR